MFIQRQAQSLAALPAPHNLLRSSSLLPSEVVTQWSPPSSSERTGGDWRQLRALLLQDSSLHLSKGQRKKTSKHGQHSTNRAPSITKGTSVLETHVPTTACHEHALALPCYAVAQEPLLCIISAMKHHSLGTDMSLDQLGPCLSWKRRAPGLARTHIALPVGVYCSNSQAGSWCTMGCHHIF